MSPAMNEGTAGMVSVLIPMFNAAKYLAETLDSVLAQDFPAIEVVVCDDGSSDDSLAVARRFGPRVRVDAGPHRGLAATRNRGIALARGSLMLHLDADDILLPGAISMLAAHLADGVDMVVGMQVPFVSPDLSPEDAARYGEPSVPRIGHLPGTALVRSAVFETHGLLDETYPIGADLAWFVAAQNGGAAIRRIDEVVLHRRIHGNNQSLSSRKEWPASVMRTVRAAMLKRRGAD